MIINNHLKSECDLLRLYLLGRWDVFLNDDVGFQIQHKDTAIFYRLLRELTPFRVQENSFDPLLIDCLSPVQLFKLQSCRSRLTDVLIAISSGHRDADIRVRASSFLAYLMDILKQFSLDHPSWIEHLVMAYQPEFLSSIRSYICAHAYAIAGVLPSKVTIVLGMHRSGTSAITGMLHASGLGAPIDALGATESNPFGYWESSYLVELSNRLLQDLDNHWSTMLDLPCKWSISSPVAQWVSDYLRGFSLVFNSDNHLVIKDPRLCLLLEPLLPCLHSGLLEVDYVLITRSPIEVVASLKKSEGIDYRQGLNLWIVSVLSSERLTRQSHRIMTTFSELLANPRRVLNSCRSMWGIHDVDSALLPSENATDFVDADLRRQKSNHIREKILSENPCLFGLLNFAERVFDVVSDDDCLERALQLDHLRHEWNQRRDDLQSSPANA